MYSVCTACVQRALCSVQCHPPGDGPVAERQEVPRGRPEAGVGRRGVGPGNPRSALGELV